MQFEVHGKKEKNYDLYVNNICQARGGNKLILNMKSIMLSFDK